MPAIEPQDRWLRSTVQKHYFPSHIEVTAPADPRSYGIEIEAEGVGPDGTLRFADIAGRDSPWRCVHDGSLRDGVEFVSNGPRSYDTLVSDLESLSAYLVRKDYVPVFSYRTSVHVHMNVMDLTLAQVFALFTLYNIFESPLIHFGGEERFGNVHCLPVSHAQNVLDLARNACYNGDSNAAGVWSGATRALCSRDNRYASFNWASMPQKGTIEFRSHRGTLDTTEVIGWVNVLDAMKAAVMGPFNDPIKVIQGFSKEGPQGFTQTIFGQANPRFVKFCAEHHDAMWEGARLVQYVAFCRQEWPIPSKAKKPPKPSEPYVEEGVHIDNTTAITPALLEQIIHQARVRPGFRRFPDAVQVNPPFGNHEDGGDFL